MSHGKLQPKPTKEHSVTSETQDSSLDEETLATTSAVGLSSRKQEKTYSYSTQKEHWFSLINCYQ
jgi:hypothetical protein